MVEEPETEITPKKLFPEIQADRNKLDIPLTLHDSLTDTMWKKLRAKVLEVQGEHCEVCGADKKSEPNVRLTCHEEWEWASWNVPPLRKLTGFKILCFKCHMAITPMITLFKFDEKIRNGIIEHYCKINECDRDDYYMDIIREAMTQQKLIESESAKSFKLFHAAQIAAVKPEKKSKKELIENIKYLANFSKRLPSIGWQMDLAYLKYDKNYSSLLPKIVAQLKKKNIPYRFTPPMGTAWEEDDEGNILEVFDDEDDSSKTTQQTLG